MSETTEATSLFAPLWRRKWLILAVAIVAALATYLYYKRQTPVYQSTTQIYLGAGAEEQAPGEKGNAKALALNPTDQVAIINSIVIEGVRQQLRKEEDVAAATGKAHAKAVGEKSQFITIFAEAHRAKAAALLANSIATAYIRRQHLYYQRAVLSAISVARRQLRRIEAASASALSTKPGSKGASPTSPSTASVLQSANLASKINQLEAELSVSGAQHVKPAKPAGAQLLSPKPRKNAIFGFVVGLLLASVAAYGLSRLDRRLRSLAAIETVLGFPILSALPSVRRPIVSRDGRPSPSGPLLEPLRRLHANLELLESPKRTAGANGSRMAPRVILFTSADPGDGKSTLIADLALVQSDAGARVAVVEANLRRPVQAALLNAAGPYGLAEVLTGTLPAENAMQRVPVAGAGVDAQPAQDAAGVATEVEPPSAGSLSLLAGGTAAANPPALLAGEAMKDLLSSLAEDRDYVLVDAPSPLGV
ncbi:MAG: tyrosine-protein kinase, partial [Solirubrobacteraceae bacterium]|nr:tyrosine-protein kinase [Solirubrobacteraceae bacterium]